MRQALPFAGVGALRRSVRRAAFARSGLAAATLVLGAAAYGVSPLAEPAPAAASGTPGTVALVDVSGSITDRGSDQIQHALGTLIADAGPAGRVGLVLFSDVALEALPPTAPAAALQAYRRFFVPIGPRKPGGYGSSSVPRAAGTVPAVMDYPESPWHQPFSGGTTISAGLVAARRALARAGMDGGRVILLSDLLDSPDDEAALRRELAAYADRPGLTLEVRRLSSGDAPLPAVYRRLLGPGAVQPAATGAPPAPQRPAGRPLPLWPLLLAGACAVALAANELLNVPLSWREAS